MSRTTDDSRRASLMRMRSVPLVIVPKELYRKLTAKVGKIKKLKMKKTTMNLIGTPTVGGRMMVERRGCWTDY